ncbi:unnamed protein product [Arctia plantaginis]|uniref:Ribonucleases P/MRP subunit Pop8-like domain-containing protein n=1 Tax=Arctia plantaginis TaxID=874455 RepID=A0A8S0ZWP9_ARCPL|nr:unnamed protein product [Arctia plantaginis]
MSSKYYYLDIETSTELSALTVRRSIEVAAKSIFGECGAAELNVDVLRSEGRRALLRVHEEKLRKLWAALTLAASELRVLKHSPSLQALI